MPSSMNTKALKNQVRRDLAAMENKVLENRLRRMADRQGYRLQRSRARDPRDLTYGGYQLINLESGGVDFGWGNANRGYAASLKDVEEYLTQPTK
jgi:hypothetical protein